MNWGKKIAILYIGFVVMVLAMVVFAMTRTVDLVNENYYAKGIDYQNQLDKLNRTKSLREKVKIENKGSSIEIIFPNKPDLNKTKDYILFYKPSETGHDIKMFIEPDSIGFQKISTSKLSKGFWKIQINWTSSGLEYYYEDILNIP